MFVKDHVLWAEGKLLCGKDEVFPVRSTTKVSNTRWDGRLTGWTSQFGEETRGGETLNQAPLTELQIRQQQNTEEEDEDIHLDGDGIRQSLQRNGRNQRARFRQDRESDQEVG